jgi:hypothetical protein
MTQDELNKAESALRRLIKFAEKAADGLCAQGHSEASAEMRFIQADLIRAYARGRKLRVPCDDGSVIAPRSGTK